jgi:hypothetical protein
MSSVGVSARSASYYLAAVAAFEIVSTLAFLAAAGFSPATVNDPTRLVGVGSNNADLLRAAALLDMFGYLAAVPLALYLRERYRGETAIDLFTLAGTVSLFLGALGAATFAFAGPPLIHEYVTASASTKQAVVRSFATVQRVVFSGLWQTLDGFLDALWLIGTGRLAWRKGPITLAMVLIAAGVVSGGIAITHVIGVFPGS